MIRDALDRFRQGLRKTRDSLFGQLRSLFRGKVKLDAETLDRIERGDCPRTPQDHGRATHAPPIEKGEGRIDWAGPARRIVDLVRAMNCYYSNLIEGHGLVYNVGERVEGYTNLLWTLWMAALHHVPVAESKTCLMDLTLDISKVRISEALCIAWISGYMSGQRRNSTPLGPAADFVT